MSSTVFPTLSIGGIGWDIERKPTWKAKAFEAISGLEIRTTYWATPIWHYVLTYTYLKESGGDTDLSKVLGFFQSMYGSFDTWLFKDPFYYALTTQNIGAGTGTEAHFQIIRKFDNWNENLKYIKAGTLHVFVAGVEKTYTTHYTEANGLITFEAGSIPSAGQAVTVTCEYYLKCRFTKDNLEFDQFASDLHKLKKMEFKTVKE